MEALNTQTMSTEEEKYKKELKDSGVDMPELEGEEGETPEEKAAAEAKAKEEADLKAKEEADAAAKKAAEEAEDDGEDDKTKDQNKKRSIYDDYKDKKKDLKTAEEKLAQSEKEKAELQQKLDAINKADTPTEKKDALDKFDAFAEKIGADPSVIKEMRELFLDGIKPDEALQKDLLEFKQWKADNAKQLEEANFEKEFNSTLPVLKNFFPNANDEEMKAIKGQINKLAHTAGWNDKDLEYIAFKHKDSLSALISPRKRGLESKDKKDVIEDTYEFDPNADLSTLSSTERAKWEDYYRKNSKVDGLTEGKDGKKIII